MDDTAERRPGGDERQFPLPLTFAPSCGFKTFCAAPENLAAVRHLEALAGAASAAGAPRQLYLWGEAGVGKTHLLQAACRRAAERGRRPAYLSLKTTGDPAALAGLETLDLVCLDDLDAAADDAGRQRALFNFINAARAGGCALALAGQRNPRLAPELAFKDLVSRFLWGAVYRLRRPAPEALDAVVRNFIEAEGCAISPSAVRYILRHRRRDMASLSALLSFLVQRACARRRRLTLPFVLRALAERRLRVGG